MKEVSYDISSRLLTYQRYSLARAFKDGIPAANRGKHQRTKDWSPCIEKVNYYPVYEMDGRALQLSFQFHTEQEQAMQSLLRNSNSNRGVYDE